MTRFDIYMFNLFKKDRIEEIEDNSEELEQTSPSITPENSHIVLQNKFWHILIVLMILPVFKSTVYNGTALCQGVFRNITLRKQKRYLENDKKLLQSKLKEYNSKSGLKRTIKEEINLVEKNEIVIKIIES